jgi:hypothetical protein
VTVNDGASLEVRQAALNATLKLDSLTLGSAAGPATATFNLGGFANPSSAVVNVTNVLTLNGTTTVNLSGTSTLTSGTFKTVHFWQHRRQREFPDGRGARRQRYVGHQWQQHRSDLSCQSP